MLNIEAFQCTILAIDAPLTLLDLSYMGKQPNMPNIGETIKEASETQDALPLVEIDARELLGHRKEATIIHAGERYRLRITMNNKLILTK